MKLKLRHLVGIAVAVAAMGITKLLLAPGEEPAPSPSGGAGIEGLYQPEAQRALDDMARRP